MLRFLCYGLVSALAVAALAFTAASASQTPPPPPLQERIPATEAADTATLVQIFDAMMRREYAAGVRPAPRGAHPKAHGCVHATFTVRKGLAPAFRYGAFSVARSYPAWIRFSNGSPKQRADDIGDGRGMAIKVIGVAGPKLIPDEKHTQDFVMINFPVFFSPNAHDYLGLSRSILDHTEPAFLKTHPRDAVILHDVGTQVTRDMFAETFYSMSPYTLGKRYMKFRALPVRCTAGPPLPAYPGAIPNDTNYLRERMKRDLAAGTVCYQLQIQFQTDAATQPIEDPTVEWKTSQAPFVTAADIVIPNQSFTSPAEQRFCEDLTYTPWHGSVEQRPVGGINRIRLPVYQASAALRHGLEHAQHVEPTGNERFQ